MKIDIDFNKQSSGITPSFPIINYPSQSVTVRQINQRRQTLEYIDVNIIPTLCVPTYDLCPLDKNGLPLFFNNPDRMDEDAEKILIRKWVKSFANGRKFSQYVIHSN